MSHIKASYSHFYFLHPLSFLFLQNMQRIFFLVIAVFGVFLCGCNSAFRSSKTRIIISKEVANYLSNTQMIVHNNSPKKRIERTVTIENSENDTQFQLTYKKLKGNILILQITDSTDQIRNVAIPQIKLSAYPFLISTTVSPSLTYFVLTKEDNTELLSMLTVLYHSLAITIDAYAGAGTLLAKRHGRYTVPRTFKLSNVSDVKTIDPSIQSLLLDVPIPINPNPTPYLTQNYKKKWQYIFSISSSYGIAHESSRKLLEAQTSRVYLPNNISPGIWFSAGIHIQPNSHYQWGYSYHSKLDPNFSSKFLINEIGYLIPIKKGKLEIGGGLGWGMTKRNHENNYTDSFNTYKNKRLSNNTLLEEAYTFIPNFSYSFMPVNGHIQFIYPIKKKLEITASFSYTRIPSYSDFNKTEAILTTEQISPTAIVYKREVITLDGVTAKSINQLYSLGLSLRIKI
jgi:hypothetical protein